MGLEQTSLEPILVEDLGAYNVVAWAGRFYGLPKSLGAVDVQSDDVSSRRGVLVADSLADLKQRIATEASQFRDLDPVHLEDYSTYNIVAWAGSYYGLPQSAGAVDVRSPTITNVPGVLIETSLETLKQRLEAIAQSENPATLPLTEFGLPELIQIEPIHTCNLRCIMCHVSYENLTQQRLDIAKLKKNLKGLEGRWVDVGALYEPSAHPQFADLMQLLSDMGMKICLTTNGTLLTPALVKKIADCNFVNVTFSFDGCRKETYESIRHNANYDQALERILNFKNSITNPHTYFAVNNTVLKRSIDEIPETVDFWERHGFDHLGNILMVLRDQNEMLQNERLDQEMDRVYAQMDEAARRVIEGNYHITLSAAALNRPSELRDRYPQHFMDGAVKSSRPTAKLPFNPISYFQNGDFPGMHVSCRSPFKAARIHYNGDVLLCQNQFKLGNIYKQRFTQLWFGETAEQVRTALQQNPQVCHVCDYYRFCIKAGDVDYTDQDNFQNAQMMGKDLRRVENYFGLYQIYTWMGEYFAVKIGMTRKVDVRLLTHAQTEGVLVDQTLEGLKAKLHAHLSSPPELENILSQLQNSQATVESTQRSLQQLQTETQKQIQALEEELVRSQTQIQAMESSKFWQIRQAWFRVKQRLGLVGEDS